MKKVSNPRPVYRIEINRFARKQLLSFPTKAQDAIRKAVDELGLNPRPSGVKKLKGSEDYRIRVGDYRIQYLIFDNVLLIEIVKVGQRGNFYDE